MKKFILGLVVGAAIMIPVSAFGNTFIQKIQADLRPDIKVEINGEVVELEDQPIAYNGRTYLPLREIGEKVMGMNVDWIAQSNTATLQTPVNINEEEGDGVGLDFDLEEFYHVNESLEYYEIARMIEKIKSRIDVHKTVIESAKDPKSNYYSHPDMVKGFQSELDKMLEVLPKWENLLEIKLEESGALDGFKPIEFIQ